jgi:hypothetical protein
MLSNWTLTSVLRYLLPIDSTWILWSIYPLCLFSFNFLYYYLFSSNSVEQSSHKTVDFSASACPCLCLAWYLVAVFSATYHWALSWTAWIHFTSSFYVECKPICVCVPALVHSLQRAILLKRKRLCLYSAGPWLESLLRLPPWQNFRDCPQFTQNKYWLEFCHSRLHPWPFRNLSRFFTT